MDYNDPSRRQYAQNPYATQQLPQSTSAAASQYATPSAVPNFRHSSYAQQPSATIPSTGRGGSNAQVYGFAPGSQYGSVSSASASAQTMHYAADLQSSGLPRQQDTQSYGEFGTNVMYQSQQAAQSPYDQVSRYARPGTASETLASPFGGAQTSGYYLAGTVPTSATMTDLAAPHLPSHYQPAYAQAAPMSSSTYGSTMMDPPAYSSAQQYPAQPAQTNQPNDPAFSNYQAKIQAVFSHVREGSLRDVVGTIMDASRYLVGNAEGLGLTRDDEHAREYRIRLWDEFNTAWLATLQTQFNMTDEWMRTNQPIREPRSIMTQQDLESLSRELVRLCDSVEKHGLVDYQMGVAEEEIMNLLIRCLSLLDPEPESPEGVAESSSCAAARGR